MSGGRRRSLSLVDWPERARSAPSRPGTRGECIDGPRSCPWVSCRHHLGVEVRGETVRELELPEGAPTCSLDVADADEVTLEQIGGWLGFSREYVRLIERDAIDQVARRVAPLADEKAVSWRDRDRRKAPGYDPAPEHRDGDEEPARERGEAVWPSFFDADDGAACASVWRPYEKATRAPARDSDRPCLEVLS